MKKHKQKGKLEETWSQESENIDRFFSQRVQRKRGKNLQKRTGKKDAPKKEEKGNMKMEE